AAERRRQSYRDRLVAYLHGAEFRQLCIELAWLAGARSWREAPVAPDPDGSPPDTRDPEIPAASLEQFAASGLQRRFKRLVSAGEELASLDADALHGLRLRAKRARYAAEIFATLYSGKAARRYIRRLGVLQERLGILNDGTVAASLLSELNSPAGR